MKMGSAHIRISSFGIESFKVSILTQDMTEPYDAEKFVEFILDYNARDLDHKIVVRDLLKMVVEELGR